MMWFFYLAAFCGSLAASVIALTENKGGTWAPLGYGLLALLVLLTASK